MSNIKMNLAACVLLIFLLQSACDTVDDIMHFKSCASECCTLEIDEDRYQDLPEDPHSIDTVWIAEDCLELRFSAGGCNGDDWEYQLIGYLDERGFIPYLKVRLALKDEEMCEALIQKRVSYDLSPWKSDSNTIGIQVDGWEGSLVY